MYIYYRGHSKIEYKIIHFRLFLLRPPTLPYVLIRGLFPPRGVALLLQQNLKRETRAPVGPFWLKIFNFLRLPNELVPFHYLYII